MRIEDRAAKVLEGHLEAAPQRPEPCGRPDERPGSAGEACRGNEVSVEVRPSDGRQARRNGDHPVARRQEVQVLLLFGLRTETGLDAGWLDALLHRSVFWSISNESVGL